jgi:hypothetical protein
MYRGELFNYIHLLLGVALKSYTIFRFPHPAATAAAHLAGSAAHRDRDPNLGYGNDTVGMDAMMVIAPLHA